MIIRPKQLNAQYRILLIEDDEFISDAISMILQEEGFQVDHATTIPEAEILIQNAPNLILLDIILRVGNGVTFCRNLKNTQEYQNIPVIITSASANHFVDQAKDSGAEDFLAKPFDIDDLIAMTYKYIHRFS